MFYRSSRNVVVGRRVKQTEEDMQRSEASRLNRTRAIRHKSYPKEDQRVTSKKKSLTCKCSLGQVVKLDKSPHRSPKTPSNSCALTPLTPQDPPYQPPQCCSSPSLVSLSPTSSPTSPSSDFDDKMKYDDHHQPTKVVETRGGNYANKDCSCWRLSGDILSHVQDHVDPIGYNDGNKMLTYYDDSSSNSESLDSEYYYSHCLDSPPCLSVMTNSTSLYDAQHSSKNKCKPSKCDHPHSTGSQIFHVPGIDDVIKSSHSLPSRLNKNSKKDKNDWRSLDLRPVRTEGKKILLDEIITNLRDSKKFISCVDESEILTRRMKKTLRNLLNITPKLHKCFKRGLYLVSLVQQNGKVLVTSEDSLPALEVRCEQNLSDVTVKWDFNWFAKVLCDWWNIKTLKRTLEMARHISDSSEFRYRLLETTVQMQKIIGVESLGNLHYQLLSDSINGSQILLLVANLPEDVRVNNFLKWLSVNKLRRKRSQEVQRSCEGQRSSRTSLIISRPSVISHEGDIMESIVSSIPDLLSFNMSCSTKLPRGLYIGYVKLSSFIDQLRIMVPRSLPNVFPHVKIREEQGVSREEWESITGVNIHEMNHQQELFRSKLFEASRNLLLSTGVSEDNILSHRLYTNEVFEFSQDVSFILLLPNNKNVCSRLGEEGILKPGYITLPLHQFEIYHMSTYHPDLTRRYSHVSTLMEAEVNIFNHRMRQEISFQDELKLRDQISQLNTQQKKLDETWKSMRWISEVISNARDGRISCGMTLDRLKPPSSISDSCC